MSSFNDEPSDAYRDDPDLEIAQLNRILEDGRFAELPILLKTMVEASGDPQAIAVRAKLLQTLPADGNSTFVTLTVLLKSIGLRLVVLPVKAA